MQGLLKFLLAGSPDWTVRRRMAIGIQAIGAWMIVYGGMYADGEVAGILIVNGTALTGSVLTVYLAANAGERLIDRMKSRADDQGAAGAKQAGG